MKMKKEIGLNVKLLCLFCEETSEVSVTVKKVERNMLDEECPKCGTIGFFQQPTAEQVKAAKSNA
jgi:transcription elongation factor Elf1